MVSMGRHIVLIELVACWSSQVVLRYVSEEPVAKVSDTYMERAAARRFGGIF